MHWIKVEKSTPRKPEVLRLADLLSIHPDHAFGLCVRFWIWCDDQMSRKCHALSVTNVTLDSAVGHGGFCDALLSVGWLVRDGDRIEVPNFDRHLSATAKERALSAERKARQRHGNVTEMSRSERDICHAQSVTKRKRKRKSKTPPTPPSPSEGWEGVRSILSAEGIEATTAVIRRATAAGLEPAAVAAIVEHYRTVRRPGGLTVVQLVHRIDNARPGQDPATGWPDPPAEIQAARQAEQASQRRKADTAQILASAASARREASQAEADRLRLLERHGEALAAMSAGQRREVLAANPWLAERARRKPEDTLVELALLKYLDLEATKHVGS